MNAGSRTRPRVHEPGQWLLRESEPALFFRWPAGSALAGRGLCETTRGTNCCTGSPHKVGCNRGSRVNRHACSLAYQKLHESKHIGRPPPVTTLTPPRRHAMKTHIVLQALKGLLSVEHPGVARVQGHTGIFLRRLSFFAPYVPPLAAASSLSSMSAGNRALPDSLEEWLTSKQVIEIGGEMAAPKRCQ